MNRLRSHVQIKADHGHTATECLTGRLWPLGPSVSGRCPAAPLVVGPAERPIRSFPLPRSKPGYAHSALIAIRTYPNLFESAQLLMHTKEQRAFRRMTLPTTSSDLSELLVVPNAGPRAVRGPGLRQRPQADGRNNGPFRLVTESPPRLKASTDRPKLFPARALTPPERARQPQCGPAHAGPHMSGWRQTAANRRLTCA